MFCDICILPHFFLCTLPLDHFPFKEQHIYHISYLTNDDSSEVFVIIFDGFDDFLDSGMFHEGWVQHICDMTMILMLF